MREFVYYSFHQPTGRKFRETVEVFNEGDFLKLLAHWNYMSATHDCGFMYYPQAVPQIHDIPVGGR